MPVPEAPTTPIDPAGATLANASGAPAMQAVPQSGPITISPRSRALVFSATSCATLTLSENIITLQPSSSALSASSAAYSPAIEISARLAAGSFCLAVRQLRARSSFTALAPLRNRLERRLQRRADLLGDRLVGGLRFDRHANIVRRRFAKLRVPETGHLNKDLLAGVPIMTDISSTLGDSLSLREINIRLTES